MLRRYRFGIFALSVATVYVIAVAVAAVAALISGDLGALWRLTLFTEADGGAAATGPNVLILVLAGATWAWALWQSLRGPLAGPAPGLDRDERRLRVALYGAAAAWLLYLLLPEWHWWVAVLNAAAMWAVVLRLQPVLLRGFKYADHVRGAGVLGYGGIAVLTVLDEPLDRPIPDELPLICGLAGLIWTVLVLWLQRHDGRWRRATVRYGVASLLAPLGLILVGLLADLGGVYDSAIAASEALMTVWLARSAHDLADPRHEPVPAPPLPAQPQS
ncbi:hypothetical protein [Planobispora takensis]|uniref:Uncharacterized protein n=1 Tax=Planobispora takensis TaxID=1367882 RepID=A0A8J3WUD5_9ACTN|nr:hypothetical protein [Planobispora takensis]GII01403.1 hypothetical protein Pta02_34110 [Planobispora takensis]